MTQTPRHQQASAQFTVPAKHPMVTVLGSGDALLRVIEKAFPDTDIHVRGNDVTAVGDAEEVALVQRLFDEMMLVLRTGQPMTEDAVERSIAMLRADGDGSGETPAEVLTQNILSNRGRTIRPKTLNQKRYVDAIDKHTVVFGIGPAGTGKTYLAMAKAVQALQAKQVNRIILTRPAVEAGERLGFLPGTLYEKIDPYLRPLHDALHDMLDPDSIPRLMAAGTIEVAPLAYMRGRTLNDAFIILDEAQNTSPEQMKMFLTRLGFDSKIVITGDVTQVDLPGSTKSGLRQVREILEGVDDVHFSPHQPGRRPPQARGPYRRRLREVRQPQRRLGPFRRPAAHPRPAGTHQKREVTPPMSIDVNNESGTDIDEQAILDVARYAVARMRIHPLSELSVIVVDAEAMEQLHLQWMDLPGPTDVMSFPMDELRPPAKDEDEPPQGLLGDIVLCPEVAKKQGEDAPTGHSMDEELQLLTVHGVLHLLGYDHEEPDEKAEMFGLQAAIIDGWRAERGLTGPSPAPTVT